MADLHFIKTDHGLMPDGAIAAEWFNKVKTGKLVNAKVTLPRNGKFHRKFFAMLNAAYANHEWPEIETAFGPARTSFDMFRKYVIVKAEYYEIDLTTDGKARFVPKSINFASMDEAEFEKLYSDVLDVILKQFLTNWTDRDMERAVNTMLGFA